MARVLRLLTDEEIERIDAEMETDAVTTDRTTRPRIATLREPITLQSGTMISMDLLGIVERLLLVLSIALAGVVFILA